jgi:hypothetical protein
LGAPDLGLRNQDDVVGSVLKNASNWSATLIRPLKVGWVKSALLTSDCSQVKPSDRGVLVAQMYGPQRTSRGWARGTAFFGEWRGNGPLPARTLTEAPVWDCDFELLYEACRLHTGKFRHDAAVVIEDWNDY